MDKTLYTIIVHSENFAGLLNQVTAVFTRRQINIESLNVSASSIKGVLADMVSCTKELILDGKNVKLDDLAIFSVGIVSKKGAQSAADFSLANNVKGLKLRARATGELSNAQINLDGQLKESSLYTVGGKAPDGSGSDGGSGGSDGNQGENPLG